MDYLPWKEKYQHHKTGCIKCLSKMLFLFVELKIINMVYNDE